MLAVGLVAALMLTDTVPTPRRPGELLFGGIAGLAVILGAGVRLGLMAVAPKGEKLTRERLTR